MKIHHLLLVFSCIVLVSSCRQSGFVLQSGKLQHAQTMVSLHDSTSLPETICTTAQKEKKDSCQTLPKALKHQEKNVMVLYKQALDKTLAKYPNPAKAFEKLHKRITDIRDTFIPPPPNNRGIKVLLAIDTVILGIDTISSILQTLAFGSALFTALAIGLLFMLYFGIEVLMLIGRGNPELHAENEMSLKHSTALIVIGHILLFVGFFALLFAALSAFSSTGPIVIFGFNTFISVLAIVGVLSVLTFIISIGILFFRLLTNTLP